MAGPVFFDTRLLIASTSVSIISVAAWLYERLPWPAEVAFAQDADAVGAVVTFILGSDTQLGPEFPIPAGGAVGVFPNQLESFSTFLGAEGDLLTLLVRETVASAVTDVNTVIKLTPLV